MKIIALPEIQETSDLPCDTGSDIEVLRNVFAGENVDFGKVERGWEGKRGRWAATSEAIERRAREARVWLRERGRCGEGEEGDVVVVTHGGFLHFLTEVGFVVPHIPHSREPRFPFSSHTMGWRGNGY